MNLPNALTMMRIAMIPLFIYLFYLPDPILALLTFLFASATDFLDGYLARKWQQITPFGQLMDPLADKMMQLTVLYCLADTSHAPWWVFYVLLAKECLMVVGSALMLRNKVVVSASWAGKIATGVFIMAIFALFPWSDMTWLAEVGDVLLYIAFALSICAFVHYTYHGFVKKMPKPDIP